MRHIKYQHPTIFIPESKTEKAYLKCITCGWKSYLDKTDKTWENIERYIREYEGPK